VIVAPCVPNGLSHQVFLLAVRPLTMTGYFGLCIAATLQKRALSGAVSTP